MATPDGNWLVCRVIRLAEPFEQAADCLRGIAGVESCQPSRDGRGLRVEYSVTETDYQQLLSALTTAGAGLEQGWLGRMRARWYQMLDENGRDNASQRPSPCCSRPPPGAGGASQQRK